MQESSSVAQSAKPDSTRYILIGVVLLLLAVIGFLVFGKNQITAQPSAILGEVDFNGVSPSDASDPALGKIVIKYRPHNTDQDYVEADVDVPFKDQAQWVWEGGKAGQSYDIVGEVYYKDMLIKRSQRAVATAPATDVILIFNVTTEDIPDSLRPGDGSGNVTGTPAPTPTPERVTISGVYTIHGFVPAGSTIRVYGRVTGTEKFEEVFRDVPAVNGTVIAYDNAIAGQTYDVQAELYTSNGTFIGESPYITVTAPAQNESVVIQSTAQPPSQKATVAGTIQIHGSVKQGSTVLLLQRKSGQSEYSAIARYPANRSIDFKWTEAVAGTVYDITAALQVNEQNSATANVVTATAPAGNLTLNIDTNFNLPAPNQTPSVSCGDRDATNHFNARVSVPAMENGKRYYMEIGTSAGSNNVFRGVLDNSMATTIYIQADSPHFARYAYTACSDCDYSDTSNWSGWSPTLGFKCPQ